MVSALSRRWTLLAKGLPDMAADDVTGILSRLRKLRDEILSRAKAVRETEASSSKTYEECADLITSFIITELDVEDTKPPAEENKPT